MFCLYQRKEKPSIEVNEFSKHLPAELYLFLKHYQLLDNDKREYAYTAKSGNQGKSWVQIEVTNQPWVNNDSFISIRFYRYVDKKYIVDLYQYSHQVWLYSLFRDDALEIGHGYEGCSSNADVCYKMNECKARTPKETKVIIQRMSSHMGIEKKDIPKMFRR